MWFIYYGVLILLPMFVEAAEPERQLLFRMEQFGKKIHTVKFMLTFDRPFEQDASKKIVKDLHPTNLVCVYYYGFGVENAWARGYSGENVTVAILDVGVNQDLEDLKQNIDTDRSYNFIDNNNNVMPKYVDYSPLSDHGNQISSIVAATKGNNLCSAGIAYNAALIVRKIFNVENKYGHFHLSPKHWISSDVFARAILQDCIDVSVMIMAWSPTDQYDSLDQSIDLAIREAATQGRDGHGTLMCVPFGPLGNGLANTIYTITVGGMSKGGAIPDPAFADASVITSGLIDGNNLTSSKMVTTTLDNRCVTSFEGVSAATAQVCAIIALTLEANPSLSMRDVKHILVRSSDHTGLKESPKFKQNEAGHSFHEQFGFGLVNAFKAVRLAETWEPVPPLCSKTLIHFIKRLSSVNVHTFIFPYFCTLEVDKNCLTKVEEVEVRTRLLIKTESFGMKIKAPSSTISVLVDSSIKQELSVNPTNVFLSSVHFWDEKAYGNWTVEMKFYDALEEPTEVDNVTLTIYGTCIGKQDGTRPHKAKTSTTTKKPGTQKKDTTPKKNTGNVPFVSHKVIVVMIICFLASVREKILF